LVYNTDAAYRINTLSWNKARAKSLNKREKHEKKQHGDMKLRLCEDVCKKYIKLLYFIKE